MNQFSRGMIILLVFSLILSVPAIAAPEIEFGSAKADVTGPSAMLVFMGMAEPTQKGRGISMRQHARAFVFKQGDTKMAYVISDIGMVFQGVKQAVATALEDEGYTAANLMLQGSHTHAGPAGSSHYFLYNATPMGFNKKCFDSQVEGIVKAIRLAEENLAPAELTINSDLLYQCGWNRSPRAYECNPLTEKLHYGKDPEYLGHEDGFTNIENLPFDRQENNGGLSTGYAEEGAWNNTDKRMILIRAGDKACINWFAIHPTSLGTHWKYISGDNKGYAEALMERLHPGMIAAFAQASCGDVSGNIKYGPPSPTGDYDWQHCRDLGTRQFDKASELYLNENGRETPLTPEIEYRHIYVDFSKTAPAAIGGPFSAASSEDSVSCAPFFHEGVTTGDIKNKVNCSWKERFYAEFFPDLLSVIWHEANDRDYRDAHEPKIVLISNGKCTLPGKDQVTKKKLDVPMGPEVLPVQIFRIGEFAVVGMPIEVTTMAARRIENAVKLVFNGDSDKDGFADEKGILNHVVIAQCCNAYAGYLTTKEEYSSQYYEGASCHFGPDALDAFISAASTLATSMKKGTPIDRTIEPAPRNLNGDFVAEIDLASFKWPDYDHYSAFTKLGEIKKKPYFAKTKDGTTWLKMKIRGAFPNRNLMTDSSYMTVTTPAGATYTDTDPETIFEWRGNKLGFSTITLWFDMTGQPRDGEYTFTYTSEARAIDDRHHMIDKKYVFDIDEVKK